MYPQDEDDCFAGLIKSITCIIEIDVDKQLYHLQLGNYGYVSLITYPGV